MTRDNYKQLKPVYDVLELPQNVNKLLYLLDLLLALNYYNS